MITDYCVKEVYDDSVVISWTGDNTQSTYRVYWSDRNTEKMQYRLMWEGNECSYTLHKASHIPHYFKVAQVENGEETCITPVFQSEIKKVFKPQLEKLNRGLAAVKTNTGVFITWRLFKDEVTGYSKTGMTGADFIVYRNGQKLAVVTDSTNYLDTDGTGEDVYAVAAISGGIEEKACDGVSAWKSGSNYIDIPLQIPEGGVTPAGVEYTYRANDMSVADVDGDGELEYIVKWDPTNSRDVSQKGYTGKCYIDCYRLDGTMLWRLDMGVNIRSGAHYTQFMVYDFNGDGKAEMAVKTAPGTKMTVYSADGTVKSEKFITMPAEDLAAGYSNEDNYVCSADDYRQHLAELFMDWQNHSEVVNGHWPKTLEECFHIEKKYAYPLNCEDAEALADYYIKVYAPARSPKNVLEEFEGFIFKGPEYLTMFGGDGTELETIHYPYPRVDDGLMWGDYSWNRVEPCNRVDRFLACVAYLDGERPYLIMCRGYYTRTTLAAYDFFENKFHSVWSIDSGFITMPNPFDNTPHDAEATDPVYKAIASQGNHSVATADVDGDGFDEIIYGACIIDHDGSVLFSGYDHLPDGRLAKMGHGDSIHVAVIDPDTPGFDVMHVFEEGVNAPYGYALMQAETGKVIFGEYAEDDLGRCMIGDIDPNTRGLQCWVLDTYDCKGNKLDVKLLGTNQCIHWAGDLSTQVTDGVDYVGGKHIGIINDNTHGIMLVPEGTATNNGTKGNPCLIADVFGDFREELLLRLEDNSAIRIYLNAEVTNHKLFTLLNDVQYRCGVAWQNNCYNQPGYTSFYYASDMDFKDVIPGLPEKKQN